MLEARRPLRVLWIGKRPSTGTVGDELYDRKMIQTLRDMGVEITVFHPKEVHYARELALLALGFVYGRSRYASSINRREIEARVAGSDAVVCSWEPFDFLAGDLEVPTCLVTHNITSDALPELYPNFVGRLAGARAWWHERRLYRKQHFSAISAVSHRDIAVIQRVPDHPPVVWAPPGMPACAPLDPTAHFQAELVISGTYGWPPKKRDALAFGRDYVTSGLRYPIYADDSFPSEEITKLPTPTDSERVIRVGVVTDRFTSGHKLKTAAHIASNEILCSFADVGFDFCAIPDYQFFIRRVRSLADLDAQVRQLSSVPPDELRNRLTAFKERCAQIYAWSASAARLRDILYHISGRAPNDDARARG